MEANSIPEMTDPMGRYWRQPTRAEILTDDTHALMPAQVFNELANYDTSVPSGVYPGKMWKRRTKEGHLLCWYGQTFMENGRECCRIELRKILKN